MYKDCLDLIKLDQILKPKEFSVNMEVILLEGIGTPEKG